MPRKREVHLVTGGGGYPGFSLGKQLALDGHSVILLDIRAPLWPLPDSVTFIQANITNKDEVDKAFRGVSCVYHMASYGMSGREQLNKKLIEAVNIGGTENVIQACLKHNIHRLVYTSTYNVVFGGQVIRDGDETLPYLPLNKHPDHYSKTKSIAEQKVLQANDGDKLRTCALRLAGVYGPEEQRHIPRIVNYVEQGLMCLSYGDGSLQDFLHVDNLVQGHILAGQSLSDDRNHIAAGQAYFLSDNSPINTLEFFQPLIEGLGYKMPKFSVPVKLIYFFAFITEWVHYIVARIYNFQPLMTRTEVYKSCVTHYFSIAKAQRELGYKPTKVNSMAEVVQHYVELGRTKQKVRQQRKQSRFTYFLVNIIIALVFASILMSFLPGAN